MTTTTTPQTLDQRVQSEKSAVSAAQRRYDEASALLVDLRAIRPEDREYAAAQRQLADAELAELVCRTDLEDARRALREATERARRQIIDEHRAELAADVANVDKALAALARAVQRLDDRRENLVARLDGAANMVVSIRAPWPFVTERVAEWREAMTGEGLL